eukprot:comp24107_c0_seq1/m.43600 comp24107_c0_seq1/g.43600  ORF comp24107_c0_seq1/g.43600 comp24107_c0_seq1/m.43600 type:complete len:954 (-) comp24107_c0_seq1:162-3023(-)
MKSAMRAVCYMGLLLAPAAMGTDIELGDYAFEYHGDDARFALLEKIHNMCPTITRIYDIGLSVEKRPLRVIEFGATPGQRHPGIPEFKYVGNMHGDETVSHEVILAQAMRLCKRYLAKDPEWTQYIMNTSIHLLPTINPDGFNHTIAHHSQLQNSEWCTPSNDNGPAFEESMMMRHNGNQCDLNRNFPNRFGKENDRQPNCKTQPETQAIMDWSKNHSFVLSANLHGGAIVASIPYDDTENNANVYSKSPDDDFYRMAAKAYASHMLNTRKCNVGGFQEEFQDGITNGAGWYSLHGSMQDWVYVNTDCLEITVEMSCCRNPPPNEIETWWNYHKRAIDEYMRHVHYGIKGFVRSSKGDPISKAVIHVDGIEKDIHSTPLGDYFRLMVPGKTYKMMVSAPGYLNESFTVTVPPTGPATQNITLRSAFETPEVSTTITPNKSIGVGAVTGEGMSNTDDEKFVFEHHNGPEMDRLLKHYASTYPQLVRLNSMGRTNQGRNMWVVELTNQPADDKRMSEEFILRPRVKYIANIHGDEVLGREILLAFIHHVTQNYGKDPQITQLLDSTRIYIAPSLNPDGYNKHVRENANGIDLNRNFPDQFCGEPKDGYQNETLNIMQWVQSMTFTLSISFHGGALGAFYPWDNSGSMNCQWVSDGGKESVTPDNDVFHHLATVFANNHKNMHTATCPDEDTKFEHGVYNAAHWYQLKGGMQDWNYWKTGCMEITVELSCNKWPKAEDLEPEWNNNKDALINYLKEAHRGIKGIVVQSDGVTPAIGATVLVDGNAHTVKTGPNGEFFRVLLPGNYTITVTPSDSDVDSGPARATAEVGELPAQPVILRVVLSKPEKQFPVKIVAIAFVGVGLLSFVAAVVFMVKRKLGKLSSGMSGFVNGMSSVDSEDNNELLSDDEERGAFRNSVPMEVVSGGVHMGSNGNGVSARDQSRQAHSLMASDSEGDYD